MKNGRRWTLATFLFLAVTTGLRLFTLSATQLAPDEAYYWDWSRRLAAGYYDQGPMIAYVIRATTSLFGVSEFGVRFGVLLATVGTLWCCGLLAKRLYSDLAMFLAVVLLAFTPLAAVGSLVATYDPLLVFFWALTLLCLERALFAATPSAQRVAWIFAGLTTGLGFLSKHTMLLILPCLLLFLVISADNRYWLRRPEPYCAFLLTLLLYSGVFVWNAQHHWWTFGHLLFLTKAGGHTPLLRRLGDFLGSQALLIGPVLFVGVLAAAVQVLYTRPAEKNAKERSREQFLLCMGLPIFAFFCLLTLKSKVQGNWAPCAWLTPTILWAGLLAAGIEAGQAAKRRAVKVFSAAALTGGLLTALIVFPGLRPLIGIHLPPEADTANQMLGWREMAARVQQTRTEMEQGGRKVFLAGNSYQMPGLLAFYLPDHPETHDLFLHYRLTMYAAYVERLKSHLGEDAIFVDDTQNDDHDLRQVFERVEWEPPLQIWQRPLYDKPVKTLYIARCYGYRRYTGLDWAVGG